jgi:hypothetical protein
MDFHFDSGGARVLVNSGANLDVATVAQLPAVAASAHMAASA